MCLRLIKPQMMQQLKVDSLLKALDEMHKEVNETLTSTRENAVERHNRRTHIRPYKPTVGDYVVVARIRGPRTKVSANWIGPRRIINVLFDFTAEVEHLLTKETSVVHICRMKPYTDKLVGTPVQMKEIAEISDQITFPVDKIKDLRERRNHFEVLVSWKGWSETSDSWEPLDVIYEDVPSKVREYFRRRRSTPLIEKARTSLSI